MLRKSPQIALRTAAVWLAGLALLTGPLLQAEPPEGMVRIEGGPVQPFYGAEKEVEIAPFHLDANPVTNEEFLAFVRANPQWRRSRIVALLADAGYLAHWKSDLDPGLDTLGRRKPVTRVSWFAARAYAAWSGKRLPDTLEWERAAAAGETRLDGASESGFHQRILNWYSRRGDRERPAANQGFRNAFGAWNLHGSIWEWTEDFNSVLVTGESRSGASLDRNLFCGGAAVGAADLSNYVAFMRYAMRSSLKARYTVKNLGFRCALSIPADETGLPPKAAASSIPFPPSQPQEPKP